MVNAGEHNFYVKVRVLGRPDMTRYHVFVELHGTLKDVLVTRMKFMLSTLAMLGVFIREI